MQKGHDDFTTQRNIGFLFSCVVNLLLAHKAMKRGKVVVTRFGCVWAMALGCDRKLGFGEMTWSFLEHGQRQQEKHEGNFEESRGRGQWDWGEVI